jgi:hypothetical protein
MGLACAVVALRPWASAYMSPEHAPSVCIQAVSLSPTPAIPAVASTVEEPDPYPQVPRDVIMAEKERQKHEPR